MIRVMTFNPHTNIIKQHWKLIKHLGNLQELPLFAHSKGKNIKDHLVRAETPLPTNLGTLQEAWGLPPIVGHFKCGNCSVCPFTTNTKTFRHGEIEIQLNSMSNCNTDNVIYCIWCPCRLTYIGQTSQCFRARICQHRSRIRCNMENAPLLSHFQDMGHSADSLKWQVIEVVRLPDQGGNMNTLLFKRECK